MRLGQHKSIIHSIIFNSLFLRASTNEVVVKMEMEKLKRLAAQNENLNGAADIRLLNTLKDIIIKKPLGKLLNLLSNFTSILNHASKTTKQ